ncbi:class IV adenylate cyclase [Rubripirellula reticaptiva]|uniref:CYTH domain protein n=1 Tax=Rubripirellula reticaptiva TaxID=2528013 RepID=A0A5C6FET3_9BACT|nr:class IV adenylate cyclase [Rubripirellula reticaptiva]TWU58139.1 CYTH domain protein [Rubripirellula reticaptiva]
MFEVEQKYRVDDVGGLITRLTESGWQELSPQQHSDTYYNHPSRDFGETREALRIRRVDGVPMITYKGTKLPGTVKARREMEWRLDPGDADGQKMEELLVALGFRRVATVNKVRRSFENPTRGDMAVVVDEVESVGNFAEIELVVADTEQIESARDQITTLGNTLGLSHAEQRSYLRMQLESAAK